jgi:SAM-dependent methyltransferase
MADDMTEDWRQHSHYGKARSLDDAAGYCEKRFEGSRRQRRLNRRELDFAQDVMDLAGPDSSVLDAPCGSGRFFHIFSKARKLTMLDYSEAMIKVVQDRYGQDKALNLVQGDIAALPFEDQSFDLVFSMRLLHHVGDDDLRWQIIAQLARVSRRYVALSVYSKNSLRYIRRRLLGKRPSGFSVSLGDFIAEAAQAGLKLRRKYPAVSFVEQQRMLLFAKERPSQPRCIDQ